MDIRFPIQIRRCPYPEITTASVTGPETVDGKLRYTFSRAIGYKG
jgi:PRTRC genetic system protein C